METLTQEILRFHEDCKIVILSMFDDENSVVGAIRAGARGFILKRASDMDLVEALRMVAAGGVYLSPQVSDRLLTRIQKGDLESHQSHSALQSLSPRELQVLRLVAEGKTSKEIANVLILSEQTVRSYRKTMMRKLGVNNVAGLTHLALSTGLTQVSASKAPVHDGIELMMERDSPVGTLNGRRRSRATLLRILSSRLWLAQKPGLTLESAGTQLGWKMPPEKPEELRRGLDRRCLTNAIRSGARR